MDTHNLFKIYRSDKTPNNGSIYIETQSSRVTNYSDGIVLIEITRDEACNIFNFILNAATPKRGDN